MVSLCLLISILASQAPTPPGAAPAAESLTPAQARADFDLMREALEEAHGGLYRYSTKAEMDRAFEAQRARLARPVTRRELIAALSETIALVRCGHTSVVPDDATRAAAEQARLVPLRVAVEGLRLFVISNDTPDDRTVRPGMELLEVNGHRSADIVRRFYAVDGADGDVESGKRVHLERGFALYYWLLFDTSAEFTVKAKDASGGVVTTKLAGVTRDERSNARNPVNDAARTGAPKPEAPGETVSLRFPDGPRTAVVRVRSFGGPDFPQRVEDVFKTLRDEGTRSLILDLRGNGGGDDLHGALLVSCVTDRPFRYFDRIHVRTIDPSFKDHADWSPENTARLRQGVTQDPAGGFLLTEALHRGLAEQPPGKFPFTGKVLVLIDGGTFSTAADFCAVTHHLKRATFIGEETGGGYYGNNSGLQTRLTLPNSKLKVRIPLFAYWNAVAGYDGTRRGTRPDHPVETRALDVLDGVDRPLDLAVKLAAAAPEK